MKNLSLAIVLSVLCAGCVATAGDLRQLADSVRLQVEEGADARVAFADDLDELADELDERTRASEEGIDMLTTGGPIGLAGVALATYKAVMMARDRKYKIKPESEQVKIAG